MKNLILTILITVAIVAPYDTTSSATSQPTTREIVVRDIQLPSTPHTPTRSALPTVCAVYSEELSLLEISFTMNVGAVSIYIIDNTGQCVAKYLCNTEYESEVYMNTTLNSDYTYQLQIIGSEYRGEGWF